MFRGDGKRIIADVVKDFDRQKDRIVAAREMCNRDIQENEMVLIQLNQENDASRESINIGNKVIAALDAVKKHFGKE